MIVDSKNIEFGYELISVIPYANWLNENVMLTKTISGNDTDCLYFFSPNHEINTEKRAWENIIKVNCPNSRIHINRLDKSMFSPPNYKKQYANDRFKFKKETVIICNRFNVEWDSRPINFFDISILRKMFNLLQDKYQVVYINIKGRPELYDNHTPLDLGDYELLKEHPKVINIHDLHEENNDLSFNTLQLMLFANCEKYITMNGGHSILASYFGGENILMSKKEHPHTKELGEGVNSFYRWYRDFSNQRIVYVPDENNLLKRINDMWVEKNPVANVLVRTSGRPNFFKRCIDSILNQTYKNINIFVSIDDPEHDYTVDYPVYPVFVNKNIDPVAIANSPEYGKLFPYNNYMNDLHDAVKEGMIIYLDDDNRFVDNTAIEKIMYQYKNGNDLVLSRVKVGQTVYPEDEFFGIEPVLFHIDTHCFAFSYKYKYLAKWEPYKRGDFRVISKLYPVIENRIWLNEIFVETEGQNFGQRTDLSIKIVEEMENKIKVKIVNDINQYGKFDVKIGEVMEIQEHVAKGWFKTGIAIPFNPNIVEEKVIHIEEIKPLDVVIPEIKAEKEPKKAVKKGKKVKV